MNGYPHIRRVWNGPVFSSHEHLGSVTSMGVKGWFFRIDQEKGCVPGPTGLADLLFSPYLGGQLAQLGLAPVPGESPEALCRRALPGLRELSTKGLAQALEFAFRELYGVSLWSLTPESAKKLDREIAGRYQNYYQWYRQVMERLGCEKVLRTVHPGYLVAQGPGAEEEERFVLPLVRVDTLLGYPEEGRVNFSYFQPVSGIAPDSLENLEESVRFLFSRLIDPYKIVGLKQFQAYLRTLDSPPVSREEARAAFERIASCPGQARVVQDYLFHRILEQADRRGLVFQIHTGMTTLRNSDPSLLEPLFSRYPHVRFVLLHCYPFVRQAAYLASVYPNVYVDTAWLSLQGEWVAEKALEEYLAMVPVRKICLSQDATSLEEFYGGDRITRRALERVLGRMVKEEICSQQEGEDIAGRLLYQNSRDLYRNKTGER